MMYDYFNVSTAFYGSSVNTWTPVVDSGVSPCRLIIDSDLCKMADAATDINNPRLVLDGTMLSVEAIILICMACSGSGKITLVDEVEVDPDESGGRPCVGRVRNIESAIKWGRFPCDIYIGGDRRGNAILDYCSKYEKQISASLSEFGHIRIYGGILMNPKMTIEAITKVLESYASIDQFREAADDYLGMS